MKKEIMQIYSDCLLIHDFFDAGSQICCVNVRKSDCRKLALYMLNHMTPELRSGMIHFVKGVSSFIEFSNSDDSEWDEWTGNLQCEFDNILYRKFGWSSKLTQETILEYLKKDGEFHSTKEIALALDADQSCVYNKLLSLLKFGFVEKETRPYVRNKLSYWRISEEK